MPIRWDLIPTAPTAASRAAWFTPIIRQFVRANTTDVEVVSMFDKVCEPIRNRALLFDHVCIGNRVDQLSMKRLQPRQIERRERSVGIVRGGFCSRYCQLVVVLNGGAEFGRADEFHL